MCLKSLRTSDDENDNSEVTHQLGYDRKVSGSLKTMTMIGRLGFTCDGSSELSMAMEYTTIGHSLFMIDFLEPDSLAMPFLPVGSAAIILYNRCKLSTVNIARQVPEVKLSVHNTLNFNFTFSFLLRRTFFHRRGFFRRLLLSNSRGHLKRSEKSKTKSEEEQARPNIRVSSTPRPRAVISGPDNDAVIGYKNKIEGRQRRVSKDHGTVQNRHTTRTHVFTGPGRTTKSKNDDAAKWYTKGSKSLSSIVSYIIPSLSCVESKLNYDGTNLKPVQSHPVGWKNYRFEKLHEVPNSGNEYTTTCATEESRKAYEDKKKIRIHDDDKLMVVKLSKVHFSANGSTDSEEFQVAREEQSPVKAAPKLSDEYVFINYDLYEFLMCSLPNIVKGCRWMLLYSTLKHGANRYYFICMNDMLAVGGGGSFALSFDGDLLSGTSGPCETFGNLCLAHDEEFELKNIEVHMFGRVQ
ncbi:TLD-domain containing nucleolar protein, putative isoform 2 [Hibiscus syriacus]|uniref:TLD-domain containing nucleolar protein, putative isoform 2 n=1 Tax=Hibiscus syriacus TaxID=106335 RepID=A0A6A2XPD1_HIBSY|nr:TLD-domain containing nucleolar protein, putative isoform 2 [Hibiscus syriacus]